jgi:hypothetical protein
MKDRKKFEVGEVFTNIETARPAQVTQLLGPGEYCFKYTDGQEPSRGSCDYSVMYRGGVTPAAETTQDDAPKDPMPVELPIIEETIAATAAPASPIELVIEPEATVPAPAASAVGATPEPAEAHTDPQSWHDPFPGLPAELKSHNRWGLFKKIWDEKKQKYDKIPYSALTGQMGNFFEKDKGANYKTACNLFRKNPAEWGGIGYGFNKEYGFTGVDLDNCIDPATDEIEPWAVEICEKLHSYTEQSLSGNGLHIVVRWTMPARSDNKEGIHVNPVEIYSGKHFFAMTGLSLSDYPDEPRDADLTSFAQALENGDYRKFDKKKLTQEPPLPQQEKTAPASEPSFLNLPAPPAPLVKEKYQLANTKMSMPTTSKRILLSSGNLARSAAEFVVSDEQGNQIVFPSQSEADASLCTVLAIDFMREGTPEGDEIEGDELEAKIDAEFRKSVLFRDEKGGSKRPEYLRDTIKKGIKFAVKYQGLEKKEKERRVEVQKQVTDFIDDPNENDSDADLSALEQSGPTNVVPYPDPGQDDLVSLYSYAQVEGTPAPLGFVREPMKHLTNYLLDGRFLHPAHPGLTLRGFGLSIGESTWCKTTGFMWAMNNLKDVFLAREVWLKSLLSYKSEPYFVANLCHISNQKTGARGNPHQFLYITEGREIVAKKRNDYFDAVMAKLTDLYDQNTATTGSQTGGTFDAEDVKVGLYMCFTGGDFRTLWQGKGGTSGGDLGRYTLIRPPYVQMDGDWLQGPEKEQRLSAILTPMKQRLKLEYNQSPIVLTEELKAKDIRLEAKKKFAEAGSLGFRMDEHFMREQVNRGVLSKDNPNTMTAAAAERIYEWGLAMIGARKNTWPEDQGNDFLVVEKKLRRAIFEGVGIKGVVGHEVGEKTVKMAIGYWKKDSSTGSYHYNQAIGNLLKTDIKIVGQTRKGSPVFCPRICVKHPNRTSEYMKSLK